MKHKSTHLLWLFLLSLTAFSCKKDKLETSPVDIEIQLTVDQEEIWFDVPYEKASITLQNTSNNSTYQLTADQNGKIVLQNIAPGAYTIIVSLRLTGEEYTALTGTYRENDFYLNFTLDNKGFYADESLEIQLIASEALGDFVIKQVYYAGSHTTLGAVTRDQFLEIYNNSSETLYADSLVVVVLYGKVSSNPDDFSLPNNQHDWSKSQGMNVENDPNEDYIYAKGLFMIPSDGSGKKYPVLPGTSIIIASTAVDHSSSYVNNAGNVIGAQDPSLTVDLSEADFEVWLYPYEQIVQPGRSMFASDVDNPDVPNLETFFATGMRDLVLNPQGRDSYAILRIDGTVDLHQLPAFTVPSVTNPTPTTLRYPQLPAKFILDAVEIEAVVSADRTPRILPLKLDAGAVHIHGGPFSSQSVVRKTHSIVHGRRILQDTNNSYQDFGILNRANPYKDAASFLD